MKMESTRPKVLMTIFFIAGLRCPSKDEDPTVVDAVQTSQRGRSVKES